ncbi:hypothetical protein JKF63_03967 [Porcisia hertigi]|uniref:PH domain-containing protein n=1 Tax=Porcisia hertigi TaxID=2761500 RepID=A0A836HRA0_9TRYP|nr:hypothetical protein JKF63_03967 [Porcisia hertigi]
MHYFFLEKQSPLSQRWQVRQVAFDSKYRYLYYTKSLSRRDIEEVMMRSHEVDHSFGASLNSSDGTCGRKVKWSGKVKVTQLRYAADDYIVAPGSSDFDERFLLTLIVVGYERPLKVHRSRGKVVGSSNRSMSGTSEKSFSLWSVASRHRSTSRLSSVRPSDSDGDVDVDAAADVTGVTQPLLANTEHDVREPEAPSGYLHMPSYPVNESLDDDFDDEEENMFRDIDLVPDDEEDEEETSVEASENEEDSDDCDGDNSHAAALNSPPSTPTGSARSGYSFFSRQRRGAKGCGMAREERTVQLHFRAANYDVFRIVSLRVRQALVRHGLCGPLHAGLPPYDPRNGIALATVPLHLRNAFRRLNDVVFYSLQIGHVVYVRQQREVRGIEGYLCITHDSILLLQLDGKCPRWLDLEDIIGVQYVLHSNHSFISIRAAEPYPDFVFIPIIPCYPPNSTFDSEECIEGTVSMVRRLLIQRLRAGEEVALAPVSDQRISAQTAEDIEEYDALCHISDLSDTYADVFQYIAQEQTTGHVPLRWRWDNSKTPSHFTFKRDLFHALEREDGDDSDDDDEANASRSQRRPLLSAAAASHAHMVESVVPSRQQQHLSTDKGLLGIPASATVSRSAAHYPAAHPSSSNASPPASRKPSRNPFPQQEGSLYWNTSFMPATMTQLMAPPSHRAELRAKKKLLVTRTDRRNPGNAKAAEDIVGNTPPTLLALPSAAHTVTGANPGQRQEAAATQPIAPTKASAAGAPAPGGTTAMFPSPHSSSSPGPVTGVAPAAARPTPQKGGQTASPALGSTRPTTAKPNTYGLVPSQQHTDPAALDYWFSAAAASSSVAPVATAQKGVQLSKIHSSIQQEKTSIPQPLSTQLAGTAAGVSGSSSSRPTPAPAPTGSTLTFLGNASGSRPGLTQCAPSSSSVPLDSITNASRSPREVTHTAENISKKMPSGEDEESDEDFDSEDMEDMLQRPEGLVPPPATGATALAPAASTAPRGAASAAAGATTGERKDAVIMGTDGAAFVPIGDGVVTQVVLTAEMLPGYRGHRDKDRRSDGASAPSPSLQARPELVAFIPPTALPH